MTEDWVSTGVIAEHLGVAKDSAYTWTARTTMPPDRFGRLLKSKVVEVDKWVLGAGAGGTSKASREEAY